MAHDHTDLLLAGFLAFALVAVIDLVDRGLNVALAVLVVLAVAGLGAGAGLLRLRLTRH